MNIYPWVRGSQQRPTDYVRIFKMWAQLHQLPPFQQFMSFAIYIATDEALNPRTDKLRINADPSDHRAWEEAFDKLTEMFIEFYEGPKQGRTSNDRRKYLLKNPHEPVIEFITRFERELSKHYSQNVDQNHQELAEKQQTFLNCLEPYIRQQVSPLLLGARYANKNSNGGIVPWDEFIDLVKSNYMTVPNPRDLLDAANDYNRRKEAADIMAVADGSLNPRVQSSLPSHLPFLPSHTPLLESQNFAAAKQAERRKGGQAHLSSNPPIDPRIGRTFAAHHGRKLNEPCQQQPHHNLGFLALDLSLMLNHQPYVQHRLTLVEQQLQHEPLVYNPLLLLPGSSPALLRSKLQRKQRSS